MCHFSEFVAMRCPLAQYVCTHLPQQRSPAAGTSFVGRASCTISPWVKRPGVSALFVMALFTRRTSRGETWYLLNDISFWNVTFTLLTSSLCCSVIAMETRQYAIGDVITMQLMRREKGVLIALPKSQWMNVVQPVYVRGECVWVLVVGILLLTTSRACVEGVCRSNAVLSPQNRPGYQTWGLALKNLMSTC